MEQKLKFVVIGLAGIVAILIISLFVNISAKQAVVRERDEAKKENESLVAQINDALQKQQDAENKARSLAAEVDRLTKVKDDLSKKYELTDRARLELVEQIKQLKTQKEAAPQSQVAPSQVVDAYWGGIIKAKTDLEIQLASVRNELKIAQINNEQIQRERNALDFEINNLKRENQDLKRQIEYNQKIMDSVTQDLVREKNDKMQIEEGAKPVKDENLVLRRQLESLNNRKISLDRRLADMQDKNAKLESRFNEMDVMLREKMAQVEGLQKDIYILKSGKGEGSEKDESVELPPIVVRPKEEVPVEEATTSLTGKVLAVNKDNNFVVIDLGEDSGVKLGEQFQVYKEGKPTAGLEVIQVRKSISACDIKSESSPIKIGDTVK